jgi:NTE family protein
VATTAADPSTETVSAAPPHRIKVAIACQGGGSQTAFTAGVLKALAEAGVGQKFEVVGISGTSGGALCASLVWYGFQKGDRPVWKRLIEFWRENTAQSDSEKLTNRFAIEWMRMVSRGLVPSFQSSPYSPFIQAMSKMQMPGQRPEYSDFPTLLRRHIDFDEIAAWGPQTDAPVLIIGAASVTSGRLRKFNSSKEVIKMEHLLASAAVPNLFAAVDLEGDALWDGLFSDNPPIDDLLRKGVVGAHNVPEELWVIKINPTARSHAPQTPDEITDRRNQLEGNISLFQNLKWVEMINDMIMADAFRPEFLEEFDIPRPIKIPKAFSGDPDKPYHIPWIEMTPQMQSKLDYLGKLDRSPENLDELLANGEACGKAFLEEREKMIAAAASVADPVLLARQQPKS